MIQMQEKTMVTDALNHINSGLKAYADMISQTENPQLRNALIQMRNETEKSQYELYQIAKSKNYYQPPAQASPNEIQNIKSVFSGNTGWTGSQGMTGSSVMQGQSSGSMAGVGAGSGMFAGVGQDTTR